MPIGIHLCLITGWIPQPKVPLFVSINLESLWPRLESSTCSDAPKVRFMSPKCPPIHIHSLSIPLSPYPYTYPSHSPLDIFSYLPIPLFSYPYPYPIFLSPPYPSLIVYLGTSSILPPYLSPFPAHALVSCNLSISPISYYFYLLPLGMKCSPTILNPVFGNPPLYH